MAVAIVNPRHWGLYLGILSRRWLCYANKCRSHRRNRSHREALSPPFGLVTTLLRRFDGRSGRDDQNAGCFWCGPAQQGGFLSGICISTVITVAVWSPICIFAFVITRDHGATFNTVLWIFETFAWAIGGI